MEVTHHDDELKLHVLEARCKREVVRLHDFFVDWFTGSCPNTDEAYQGVTSALSPTFSMIVPGGAVVPLPDLRDRLRGAHGAHKEQGMVIEIKNVQLLQSDSRSGIYFVRYEEWQRSGNPEEETARISTALLKDNEGGPNNVIWTHVHETWMPGKGPKRKS